AVREGDFDAGLRGAGRLDEGALVQEARRRAAAAAGDKRVGPRVERGAGGVVQAGAAADDDLAVAGPDGGAGVLQDAVVFEELVGVAADLHAGRGGSAGAALGAAGPGQGAGHGEVGGAV